MASIVDLQIDKKMFLTGVYAKVVRDLLFKD